MAVKEIEVRTLSGESTTITVSPETTINDLKHLLKLSFAPATSSPNFHLFFKGTKLNLQCKVSSLAFQSGEFFVLIPFTKKNKPQVENPSFSNDASAASSFADSTYSDMMQEFSYLRDNSRKFSEDRDLFEEKNCEKFVEVLQSMNCLSSPYSGKCMLLSEAIFRTSDDHASCLCPTWLRGLVEAFALLSILWAFLQLQTERMTTSRLKQVLGHLEKFGVGICMEDIEHLSVLCPKGIFPLAKVPVLLATKPGSAWIAKECILTSMHLLSPILQQRRQTNLPASLKLISFQASKTFWTVQPACSQSKKNYENLLSFSLEDSTSERALDQMDRLSSTLCLGSRKEIFLRLNFVAAGRKAAMVHVEKIGARKGSYVEIPNELSDKSKSALKSIGINKLYSHQVWIVSTTAILLKAESILASLSGKNVVVATMTSSGKSVCYNLPVLEALSHNLSSCALYLFPTKALAQDQLRALLTLTNGFDCGINIGVYDGDTSQKERTWLRENARLELANLSTLELIEKDGSPSSEKFFVLWNPVLPLRTELDKSEFGIDGRNASDKSLRREILEEVAPHHVNSICAYRAGYVSEDRRRIESEFFGGKLCGIAATNALELGIDVGHIDVTLHLGFPGSIASLWQQAGRSGRRERSSLAVYVAFEGPLDQYFMKFPQKLFCGPIECCHIDAQNQQVLEQHLVCAALEHPLSLLYDEKYFGSGLSKAINALKNRGYLTSNPSNDSLSKIWSYMGHEKRPSRSISIRAIEAERYIVIDKQLNETLEEIEESRAFFQVYEGAVYLHQGRTYLVKDLDLSRKIAYCEKAVMDYYTKTRDYTDIHIVGGKIAYPARVSKDQLPKTTAQANPCSVTTTWFGFRRIRRGSNQVLDTVDLSLPRYSYESQAVWISVPQSLKIIVEKKYSFRAGLHAACHAVLHVVPLYMRCNLSDLAPECPNPYDSRFFPERILLYDQSSWRDWCLETGNIQPYFTELLHSALELLTCCHCSSDTGCPNCVQNLACQEYNELINKDAAIIIIKGVLDAEKTYFEGHPDSTPSC
ncbi:hypothetical protein GOBAR_DD22763 [Gossypium barbadense]|nr:hypothetical protein GOBAR_DD22763 [Gossypium barbadense]